MLWKTACDINPSDARIWNYKGLALHALKKYEDAIASYDKAINLRHTFVEAINNRESSKIQIKKQQQTQEVPQKEQREPRSLAPTPQPDISKKPQRNNLKILVPIIAVAIGIVIAVSLFGSGMMHQQAPPPITSPNSNPSPSPVSPPAVPTNSPPTATDKSVATNQNTPVDITLAGSDPDQNDTLTAAIVTNPSHGTLSSINQQTGVVTYTPNSGFTGFDSFTFKVNDGKTDSSNTAMVSITVGI